MCGGFPLMVVTYPLHQKIPNIKFKIFTFSNKRLLNVSSSCFPQRYVTFCWDMTTFHVKGCLALLHFSSLYIIFNAVSLRCTDSHSEKLVDGHMCHTVAAMEWRTPPQTHLGNVMGAPCLSCDAFSGRSRRKHIVCIIHQLHLSKQGSAWRLMIHGKLMTP